MKPQTPSASAACTTSLRSSADTTTSGTIGAARRRLHEGLVVKRNSNQRYASDAVTAFLFRELGRRAGVPLQEFVVRSDLACGSTIGPIISANTGIRTVDVGAPMLSMHSVRELCGADDVSYAIAHFEAVLRGFGALDRQLVGLDDAYGLQGGSE